VLDPAGFPISPGTPAADLTLGPALAFDGTRFLVSWTGPSSSDILGARVDRAGALLDGAAITVSTAANYQASPAMAFDGTNYLVAWSDHRSPNGTDIYAARVNRRGVALDGSGIAISTAPNDQVEPSVAFDGTNYLVVWVDHRGAAPRVFGTRVSPAGAVSNPSGIAVSSASLGVDTPAVAFNGSDYLVVWTDWRNQLQCEQCPSNADVYGSRVSRAGVDRDVADIAITRTVDDQSQPSVASDGTSTLVVWADAHVALGHSSIVATRVSRQGVVLDGPGFAVANASAEEPVKDSPAVAFGGTNFLVVWRNYRVATLRSDIVGALVSTAGSVRPPGPLNISAAPGDQRAPHVAFNGTFMVVWLDDRARLYSDVYGNRVDRSGAVTDGDGFVIGRSDVVYPEPGLGVTGDPATRGSFGIAYQRFATEAPFGTSRAFFRTSPK
jgi:hypothetical protein